MNPDVELREQYIKNLKYLIDLKNTIGNIDNQIHASAMQLIKFYLEKCHPDIIDWDFKIGSQSGVDIEGKLNDKPVVIGELKTTKPYGRTDFGANQKKSIEKDLGRLDSFYVENKYFFVIDSSSYDILMEKYYSKYPTVKIINIIEPENSNTLLQQNLDKKLDIKLNSSKSIDSESGWDIEIKLTSQPITNGFFNVPKSYRHLIEEGSVTIYTQSGNEMDCHTTSSMGSGRIFGLKNWYKQMNFSPNDMFYLKKLGSNKFKVVNIERISLK